MGESKSFYSHFLTLFSGNVLSQIIPFLIAPVLTRLFTPEEFGVFANFMAIAGMIGIVSTGRLELAVTLPKEKSKAQDIVFTGFTITFFLFLISFIIPAFPNVIESFYENKELPKYLWFIPPAILCFGLLATTNNWVLRLRKFNILSYSKISQSFVNNGLACLLGYLGWGVGGMIAAWLCSQLIGILVNFTIIDRQLDLKRFNKQIAKNTLVEYKDFPLINSLHAFTDVFASQFLLFWIISGFFGSIELGLFATMFRYVKAPIALVTTSVSQLFYVEASEKINSKVSIVPLIKRTMLISGAFAIPFCLVIYFFGNELFSLYLGDDWSMAGTYAQRILPILFASFLLSPISMIPILFKKQKQFYFYSVTCYVLSIGGLVLGLFLNWNFEDSLLLYSAGYCLYYIFLFFWYYKLTKINHACTS
jgi:O-antigen/teichoic acid export membrane protein